MTTLESGLLTFAVVATFACGATRYATRGTEDWLQRFLFRFVASFTVVAWFMFALSLSAVPGIQKACGDLKFVDADYAGKHLVAICETADGGVENPGVEMNIRFELASLLAGFDVERVRRERDEAIVTLATIQALDTRRELSDQKIVRLMSSYAECIIDTLPIGAVDAARARLGKR